MEKKIFQGIDTLVIRVSNILSAKSWYTEKLGLSIVYEDDDMPLTVLNGWGQTSLTLWQTESEPNKNKDYAYYVIFKSDNSPDTREELIRRGVSVGELLSDDTCVSFVFKDNEGNKFEVRQSYSQGAQKNQQSCL
jgi:catechol 2,3-dioxygenase-like lactoylglutathione lyase family enzyme